MSLASIRGLDRTDDQGSPDMQKKITTFLTYDGHAEEAANLAHDTA